MRDKLHRTLFLTLACLLGWQLCVPVTRALEPIRSQWVFGTVSRGFAWTDDFSSFNGVGFGLSTFRNERGRVDLQFAYTYVPLDEISDLQTTVRDGVDLFTLGVDYNIYTTPNHTLFQHFFTLGLAYTNMSWRYDEPVEVDGITITRDDLNGAELYFGSGVELLQLERLKLGVEVMPGYILWIGTSSRGVGRDAFDQFYNIKINVKLSFKIRG